MTTGGFLLLPSLGGPSPQDIPQHPLLCLQINPQVPGFLVSPFPLGFQPLNLLSSPSVSSGFSRLPLALGDFHILLQTHRALKSLFIFIYPASGCLCWNINKAPFLPIPKNSCPSAGRTAFTGKIALDFSAANVIYDFSKETWEPPLARSTRTAREHDLAG